MLDGSLHLALGPFPERSLGAQQRKLYREDQFLYCAPPHPLCASVPDVWQDELVRRSRFVARTYLDMQELKLLQIPASATIADNVDGRALLILSGSHIGFLPAHYAAVWEESGRLKRVNPRRMHTHLDFKIIWRKDPQPARMVRSFIIDQLLATAEAFAPRGAGA